MRVDVVIDATRLHLLVVITRMRNALPVGAPVARGWSATRSAPIAIEWTAENRQWSPGGFAVKRKELFIERDELGRWLIPGSGYGVHTSARQLLQDIILKCRGGHGGGCDDGE